MGNSVWSKLTEVITLNKGDFTMFVQSYLPPIPHSMIAKSTFSCLKYSYKKISFTPIPNIKK